MLTKRHTPLILQNKTLEKNKASISVINKIQNLSPLFAPRQLRQATSRKLSNDGERGPLRLRRRLLGGLLSPW